MNQDEFCMNMGMSMTMYMKGFFLSTRERTLPCLSYYYRSWILTDEGKFKGAMFYAFLMALLTQGLSAVRAVVARHVRRPKRVRKLLLVVVYVFQQLLGYLIMLTAMMYSIEMLLAVVLGLCCGHQLFVRAPMRKPKPQQRSELEEPLLSDADRAQSEQTNTVI